MTGGSGRIQVYWAVIDQTHVLARERMDAWLDDDERQRRVKFMREADRHLFGMAHGLLRLALSHFAATVFLTPCHPSAWRYGVLPGGRPKVMPSASWPNGTPLPFFSLTHTQGAMAAVVADYNDVGIDIERRDRKLGDFDIAARYFAPEENAAIQAKIMAERASERASERAADLFFSYWTLKEAYVKALGAGLKKPLNSFAFTIPAATAAEGCITPSPALLYDRQNDVRAWRFRLWPSPANYVTALAYRPPAYAGDPVSIFEWTGLTDLSGWKQVKSR